MEGNLGGSTGGCVLVRLPPVGFGRYSRCLLPSSLRCISCMLKVACCNDLIETYGKSEIFALDTQRALRDTEFNSCGVVEASAYVLNPLCTGTARLTKPITITDCHTNTYKHETRNPVPSARSQLITKDG